jgi:hypothetical protein
MAPVTLDETTPEVDVQETFDYDSIVEGMADLNDRPTSFRTTSKD